MITKIIYFLIGTGYICIICIGIESTALYLYIIITINYSKAFTFKIFTAYNIIVISCDLMIVIIKYACFRI